MKTQLSLILWSICVIIYTSLVYWALLVSPAWVAWRFIVCSAVGAAFLSICAFFLCLSDHLKHKSYENDKQHPMRDP